MIPQPQKSPRRRKDKIQPTGNPTHHIDFDWGHDGDTFRVTGTLYLHQNIPMRTDVYVWDSGGVDVETELLRRFAEIGYFCRTAVRWGYGSGHVSFYFWPP